MKRCPSCQHENETLAVKCKHCGIYLENPKFNFFNYDYDYFFTSLLGKPSSLKKILFYIFLWLLLLTLLAALGLFLLPVIKFLSKLLLEPDTNPKNVKQPIPLWVILGGIAGALFFIYLHFSEKLIDKFEALKEWFKKKNNE